MNILHLGYWTKAIVLKQLWALAEKDYLWVKWVNDYSMKHETIDTCLSPGNATWIVRKIIESRKYTMGLSTLQGGLQAYLQAMVVNDKYSIKKMYTTLLPSYPKTPWKNLLLHHSIHPQHKFILCLALLRRLATVER
ncbi:hypothetical protein K7X08_016708 [Anisodus acutangulus]|uniref:Uncharacterized protein n=1 Tax=Anisodus acutangulus TaxID=402998 RepID=A0A9Q1R123_9SOLA|nr:hypothetical protein K7X08_016708 [Anisodus acutangulus]